jgi:hypothetical protein
MVSWSRDGELIYFVGKPIAMNDIRAMLADMITDAEDLLWGRLMFKEGDGVRFQIPLHKIEDNLMQTQRGKSFIHSNGLAGKEEEMLEDLVSGSRRDEFPGRPGRVEVGRRRQLKASQILRLTFLAAKEGIMTTDVSRPDLDDWFLLSCN